MDRTLRLLIVLPALFIGIAILMSRLSQIRRETLERYRALGYPSPLGFKLLSRRDRLVGQFISASVVFGLITVGLFFEDGHVSVDTLIAGAATMASECFGLQLPPAPASMANGQGSWELGEMEDWSNP